MAHSFLQVSTVSKIKLNNSRTKINEKTDKFQAAASQTVSIMRFSFAITRGRSGTVIEQGHRNLSTKRWKINAI